MSDLYLLKVYTINFRFAARILFHKILLYVFRLILIILYSIEVGFVDLLSLYSLSLYRIDFNKPFVIHLDFLCLYLSNFTNLPDMCLSLAFSITPCIKLFVRLRSAVKLLSSLMYRSDEIMSIIMFCTAILFGGYILINFWFKVIATVICSTIK